MYRRCRRAFVTLSIVSLSGFAAVRWANETGVPYHRADFAGIHFKLNSSTAQTLVSDGDATLAIQSALNNWNAVPYTALHFAPLESTSSGVNSSDGQNVIALADSPASRSAVGAAVAVTLVSSAPGGQITETDIVLNPDAKFSTALQPNTYDLQSVVTHELGHALGANHATIAAATMFYSSLLRDNSRAQLRADDASFAVDAYPGPGASQAYGTILGRASKDGAPLLGAAVIAADPTTGTTIGGLSSLSDGSFSLKVPSGNYLLFAAPLSGLIKPASLYNVPVGKVDTNFKAAASGSSDSPSVIRVDGGATVAASISTQGGLSALDMSGAGKIVTSNGVSSFSIAAQPVGAQAGQALDFILSGPGLDASITEQNVRLIGPGATIRPGTLQVETRIKDADGRAPLRFTIDIGARSSASSISLFIVRGSDTALFSGAIAVLPSKPVFSAGSLVDAASFQGAGVAPGELLTLFGAGVGPDSPVSNNGYDPATGTLPTTLAGVTVTFDGIPAPLLFAAAGQINLQVPYEVAGHASTTVIVQIQGSSSDPVSVPVLSAQPGIFMQAGSSQAIAVNQDGRVNSTANPAPKGSVVTLYATGQGVVDPPLPTGKPAPDSPLSFAPGVRVTVGGVNADVLFGGLAPGFLGLMQVNLTIPQGVPSGSQPVVLTVAGQKTPAPATLAVQ